MENVYLVVGLGNPGPQYARTRHNIGFMVLDYLARQGEIALKEERRMKAIMGIGHLARRRVILAEPQTYMNLSGEAVQQIQHYYKVPLENILIVFDDVALPFGKMRFRAKGSAGSQKGMISVLQSMGTQEIARLRVGID